MKNYFPFTSLLLVVFFFSCKKEEAEKPKVIYENSSKSKTVVRADAAKIDIADLPIHMEGTNYLIYPIGNLIKEGKQIKSAYDSDESFTVSNYGEFQITGFLKNLKFQEIGKDTIYALTEKPVLIETATYLKSLSSKIRQQLMVYTLSDLDTNKDKKMDGDDIKSLYISSVSGKDFTKLSLDFEELLDWKLIEPQSKLYFRTIEDSNKNGEFDKGDNLHYYFVNLADKEWKAQEYKPVN